MSIIRLQVSGLKIVMVDGVGYVPDTHRVHLWWSFEMTQKEVYGNEKGWVRGYAEHFVSPDGKRLSEVI